MPVLRLQGLRQRARSIFEHHLHLLSIDYAGNNVAVAELAVTNQIARREAERRAR